MVHLRQKFFKGRSCFDAVVTDRRQLNMSAILIFILAIMTLSQTCFGFSNADQACEEQAKKNMGDNWRSAWTTASPIKVSAVWVWIEQEDPLHIAVSKTIARCHALYTDEHGVQRIVWIFDTTIYEPERVRANNELSCKYQGAVGNPIRLSDGAKVETVEDFSGYFADLKISRTYNSVDGKWSFNLPKYAVSPRSLHYKISKDAPPPYLWDTWVLTVLDGNQVSVVAGRSYEGIDSLNSFSTSSKYWFAGIVGGYIFVNEILGWRYVFDKETSHLLYLISPGGNKYFYKFDDPSGLLTGIVDEYGKSVNIYYKDKNIEFVVLDDGRVVHYVYDAFNRLVQVGNGINRVTAPAGFSYKKYLYEDARFTNALTGIIDENGVRYATWSYNENGQAIESYHAGHMDYVSIKYDSNARTVTNAKGKKTLYEFVSLPGVGPRIKSVSGQASENCLADTRYMTYYGNGFAQSETDARGSVTLYERDLHGRVTKQTKGLRWSSSVTPGLFVLPSSFSASSDPSEVQQIETCWHSTLNQPSRIIEPTRITLFDYTEGGKLKSQIVKHRPAGVVNCLTPLS